MLVSFILAASFLFATTCGAGVQFTYDDQGSWPGVCINNNNGRQSPINIQASGVRENSSLIDLVFSQTWTSPVDGIFKSGGHNVQFDPDNVNSPAVTIRTHLGTYLLLQMHMHWGRNDQEGAEHTVDGTRYPLELHFVHRKEGATDPTASDYHAVIGVFAQANATAPISGVWAQLNASAIRAYPSNITVDDLVYNDLLPPTSQRGYYHYEGSLTTPGCDEVVQWFVLQDPIQVPAQYLAYLRQVESANENETLTFNFRDIQPLGQRSVYTVGSGAPKALASVIFILIAIVLTMYFSN